MSNSLLHFGLKSIPLSKSTTQLWSTTALCELKIRFQWLLDSPGIGLITGEAGTGKTVALRELCQPLSTHEYQVIYHCETDFGRVDLYRQLALDLGLEPAYRRACLWRSLKARIQELTQTQHCLPIWVIDEAQNLPAEFFRDFPSFMNFVFDSKALMTVWFVGHPYLDNLLKRAAYTALRSRIQFFLKFEPLDNADDFKAMIIDAFKRAGATTTLLSDSGIDLIRHASKGRFRQAGQIIYLAMQLAVNQGLNNLQDDIIKQAIEELH